VARHQDRTVSRQPFEPFDKEPFLTTETVPPTRRRGGRSHQRRQKQLCAREGCTQSLKPGSRYGSCSMLCYQVCRALEEAERVAKATDGPAGTEHWLTAVALNDALTAY
jgi:hypothetical protein